MGQSKQFNTSTGAMGQMNEKQAKYIASVICQFGFKPVIHPPVASDRSWVVTAHGENTSRMIRDKGSYEHWRKEFAYGDPSDLLDLWRSINRQGKNNVRRI